MLVFCAAALFADSVAGLKWTAPPGWTSQGRTSMRAATCAISPAPGDREGAECVVYFFGAGRGGSVEANIERWKGQFSEPGGHPAAAKVGKRTIHALPVTTIQSAGDYSGMAGPMTPGATVKHHYRLLGAIIEGPGGNVFIKFAGPEKTVATQQGHFEELLNSFAKE